ncbi:hypothetical protein Tco_1326345 [Tanacetum coccineum]
MEGQSSHASVNPTSSVNTSSDAGTGINCTNGDMAWEWGVWKDPTKKENIWCTLCDKKMSGAITRLKQHFTHTKGDVTDVHRVAHVTGILLSYERTQLSSLIENDASLPSEISKESTSKLLPTNVVSAMIENKDFNMISQIAIVNNEMSDAFETDDGDFEDDDETRDEDATYS